MTQDELAAHVFSLVVRRLGLAADIDQSGGDVATLAVLCKRKRHRLQCPIRSDLVHAPFVSASSQSSADSTSQAGRDFCVPNIVVPSAGNSRISTSSSP